MVWKGHGRRSSACPKAPTGITSLCSAISTDPLLHTQLIGWRQRTKTVRGCKAGNAGLTLAAALRGSQGSPSEGADCSPKRCCLQWNRCWRHWLMLLPLSCGGSWGGWGALAPCLCWAARLQCSSALTWGSGGDFLHTNPSQTRKSLVLVLCLCYYKLPVWQLEQKILLVLLKQ